MAQKRFHWQLRPSYTRIGMSDIKHTVIVLAAGSSSRLGYPKQLLTREHETLVHRTVRIGLDSKPERLLLITGAYRDAIVNAVADLPIQEVFNEKYKTGMASSIAAGAVHLSSFFGLTVIVGCDQAALESSHLKSLIAAAKQNPFGYAALQYPEENCVGIPAVIPAQDLKKTPFIHADHGLRDLFRNNLKNIVLLNAPELQKDLDTPEDIQYAIKQRWIDQAGIKSEASYP
jgi:molybdenum cofactor cytidylyltransferase